MAKPTFNVSEDGTTVEVDGTTYLLDDEMGDIFEINALLHKKGYEQGSLAKQIRLYYAASLSNDPKANSLLYNRPHNLIGRTVIFREGNHFEVYDDPKIDYEKGQVDRGTQHRRISPHLGMVLTADKVQGNTMLSELFGGLKSLDEIVSLLNNRRGVFTIGYLREEEGTVILPVLSWNEGNIGKYKMEDWRVVTETNRGLHLHFVSPSEDGLVSHGIIGSREDENSRKKGYGEDK